MKRRTQFVLSLLLAFVFVLPMSAGFVKAEETEGRELVFWHSMTEEAGTFLNDLVEEFNESEGAEQNISVEAVYQGAYADSATKLRTIIQSGQTKDLPDVMQVDAAGVMSYRTSDNTYSVSQAMEDYPGFDLEQILDVPLAYWNFDDEQLGLPFSSSTTVLFYNKTLLDEAGFDKAPTTFEEIIELQEQLPETNEAGDKIYAFAGVPNTPSLANWIGQIPGEDVDTSYVLDKMNGRAGQASEVIADDEGTLQRFLTAWKAMYDAGALLNEPSGTTDRFIAGEVAMITNSSSGLGILPQRIDGNFEMGVSFLPRIDEDANFGATVSGSGIFMFDRLEGENTEAAWDFVQYLMRPDVQAEFSLVSGYFPAVEDAYEEEDFIAYTDEHPEFLVPVEQVRETSPDIKGIIVGPSWDFYMEIQNQVFTMLDEGWSVEEGTEALDEVLTDLLTTYNESNPIDE